MFDEMAKAKGDVHPNPQNGSYAGLSAEEKSRVDHDLDCMDGAIWREAIVGETRDIALKILQKNWRDIGRFCDIGDEELCAPTLPSDLTDTTAAGLLLSTLERKGIKIQKFTTALTRDPDASKVSFEISQAYHRAAARHDRLSWERKKYRIETRLRLGKQRHWSDNGTIEECDAAIQKAIERGL